MREIRLVMLTLTLLLTTAAAPAVQAQEPRDFSGTFTTQVVSFEFEKPVFYVSFVGAGESDLLGEFSFDYGAFAFDGSDFRVYDGFMILNTAQGELWCYFEGEGVFTGRFNGVLYFYGGTGIYEKAWGGAELAAQFWRRDFTKGDATFSWVGTIWY